jgi:hypothetical protein
MRKRSAVFRGSQLTSKDRAGWLIARPRPGVIGHTEHSMFHGISAPDERVSAHTTSKPFSKIRDSHFRFVPRAGISYVYFCS